MDERMSWLLVIVGGLLAGLTIVAVVGGVLFLLTRPGDRPAVVGSEAGFQSNGERIYFTGVNDRGERIPFSDGPRWLYVHGGGCAACHGPDGRGGTRVMMGTAIPSDIRYHHLVEEEAHEEDEGEEHPPYTDALIKRAIREGLDPAGRPLDRTMPRWQLSARDMEDLLGFLKDLDEAIR
jgi:mono/diheme cytochrome c family protein